MKPFITTFTGKRVNPLDLHPEDICIQDIAHHLALLNRFVGATHRPVNIAQHSVYVSRLLHGTPWEREGLFHDAAEAYLGDISKWVKRMPEMAMLREAEDRAWITISRVFALDVFTTPETNPILRGADDLMVRYEALRMCHRDCHMFALDSHPRPSPAEIQHVGKWAPWTWRESERGFLDHARLLKFKI